MKELSVLLYSCCIFATELLTRVEYLVGVELNVSAVVTLDLLRSLLSNGSFSLSLNPSVNVTHTEITTGQNGAVRMLMLCSAVMCTVLLFSQLTKQLIPSF